MSNTTTRHSTKEKSEMKWTRGHFISCYDPWGGKYYATEKDKSLWSSCAVQWSSITLFVGRAINRVVRAHVRAHANEWTKYLMCPFHELLSCSALKGYEGFQTLWNRCAHFFPSLFERQRSEQCTCDIFCVIHFLIWAPHVSLHKCIHLVLEISAYHNKIILVNNLDQLMVNMISSVGDDIWIHLSCSRFSF